MDGFPSGQRGQTVNLLQIASVVRIHLRPFHQSISVHSLDGTYETESAGYTLQTKHAVLRLFYLIGNSYQIKCSARMRTSRRRSICCAYCSGAKESQASLYSNQMLKFKFKGRDTSGLFYTRKLNALYGHIASLCLILPKQQ